MTFHPTEEHIPATHTTEEPTAPRPREEEGGGGGGKGQYPTEDIHSTGTGISGTAGRIREISQNVGNVSIDSKSFGALNEEFSATAQQHVRTTQQHVEATSKEVDAAADATHSTASSYQATEQNNTKLFTDIQNGRDGSGSQRTAPEDTTNTQPGSTEPSTPAPAAPPPDPTTSAPSGGTTSPSGTSAPADPRAVTPGGPPSRPSWRDEINDPRNFTPDEQAKINDALHKMAQDPEPGKVAGAGALTPEQRQLMGRVQKLVTIEPDTPMQKAMPQGSANDYLGNVTRTRAVDGYDFDPNSMAGFVARQQDGTNLHSNGDVIQGNRLDYPHTRFNVADPNEPVYVMRYPADDPSRYSTPLGAPYSDTPGMLGQHDPAVQGTADDMTGAAHSAGIPPGDYHREVNPWPYSGVGVTADEHLGLPERVMSPGPIPDGAEMYSYDQYGNQTLVGRYDEATGRWTDLRPSSAP